MAKIGLFVFSCTFICIVSRKQVALLISAEQYDEEGYTEEGENG
jgi:hypothetical protein